MMKAFAEASGDTNPMHCDPIYASRTPFGRPVVYGILMTLKSLSWVTSMTGPLEIQDLKCDFRKPAHPGEVVKLTLASENPYRIEVSRGGEKLAKISFEGQRKNVPPTQIEDLLVQSKDPVLETHTFPHREGQLRSLANQIGLDLRTFDAGLIRFLIWTSYCAGMLHPGRQALYTGLKCRWRGSTDHLEISNIQYDERFSLTTISGQNEKGSEFQMSALRRPAVVETPVSSIPKPPREWLTGKRVLVTGGSRGLGATLARFAALSGAAEVDVTYVQNKLSASDSVSEIQSLGKKSRLIQADFLEPRLASDSPSLVLNTSLSNQKLYFGGAHYELVFLNALTTIEHRPFDDDRSYDFASRVNRDIQFAEKPLKELMPISKSGTVFVFISSTFVSSAEPGFLAYIQGKKAVESLMSRYAQEYSQFQFLTFRLPRLLTDQTNSPLFPKKRMSTIAASQRLFHHLEERMAHPSFCTHEIVEIPEDTK